MALDKLDLIAQGAIATNVLLPDSTYGDGVHALPPGRILAETVNARLSNQRDAAQDELLATTALSAEEAQRSALGELTPPPVAEQATRKTERQI